MVEQLPQPLTLTTETVGSGDLTIHIRVDDPDYDVSATGEDQIAENTTTTSNRGPLKIYVARGSDQLYSQLQVVTPHKVV